ncbi:MAG: GGDEF domain-containing protein [Lachnospiraceae bacterium]|nr:GGDEF domain-containing protein [Lachnospiraceae bacterium]
MANRGDSLFVSYDCESGRFRYSPPFTEQFAARFDTRPLWQIMEEDGMSSKEIAEQFHAILNEISIADIPKAQFEEYFIRNTGNVGKWYRVGFIASAPGAAITVTFTDIDEEVQANERLRQRAEYDELTGLYNRNAFCRKVDAIVEKNPAEIAAGEYAMVYFDVQRFKAINDMFGMKQGDRLLNYIADTILGELKEEDVACRIGSDRFIFFTQTAGEALEQMLDRLFEVFAKFDLLFEVVCNMGIYITEEKKHSAVSMMDRAILAQSTVKGSYTERYSYYTEAMRNNLLSEQEIAGIMAGALAEKQFVVYYQPQYNHSTGALVGAEALVRWKHPERGLISPGLFIPIFEKNGFITKLDLYVFEEVCRFQRKCMDSDMPLVPISANFSRYDIFQPNFVEKLEALRTKYDVPVKYVRVEITESAIVGGSQRVNEIVKSLRERGYVVEMDDFGTGYSSLNVLKEIELDIIKLDMLFLSEKSESNRGGTIISSIVRMAKWLDLPVIAEGVETVGQADFLKSIGCEYIQGYLYSKPLPEEDFEEVLKKSRVEVKGARDELFQTEGTYNFWEPKSLETLIFNNYAGGAAIIEMYNERVEVLRINKKYLRELGMNISEKELIEGHPVAFLNQENRKIYFDTLQRAIDTADEEECEIWCVASSSCCGEDTICLRCNIRIIGRSDDRYLFYVMIRNITTEKEYYASILDSERRFKMASEQANIYYWEYDIATKEMHPCFRCMRDLGLPELMTNYPESAIEAGVFPPEVADLYRDWHKRIEAGEPSLEAIMPLTKDKVPFWVRYTTEFDENGRPVKAYGSATLVKYD